MGMTMTLPAPQPVWSASLEMTYYCNVVVKKVISELECVRKNVSGNVRTANLAMAVYEIFPIPSYRRCETVPMHACNNPF
jgi:hypothetical protein